MRPFPSPMQLLARFALRTASIVAAALLATGGMAADGPMGVERVARLTSPGYQSGAPSDDTTRWVQVDLGRPVRIDTVKLFPLIDWGANSQGFPARYRLDGSDDPTFATSTTILDRTAADQPDPHDEVGVFPAHGITARYVRLTATKLRGKQLALTKLEVISGRRDVAEGCPASDSVRGALGRIPLTRPERPQGEEDVTDNPGNVIPASHWHPVSYRAQAPLSGVRLGPGPLRTAMENNAAYLLNSFSVDELLRPFRDRAGKPGPPGLRPPIPFWDTDLPGSNAGRFLMGAGNTVRWMEAPELRRRMDAVVDGIADCARPDGYAMGYPDDTIFTSERAAYTRSWTTRGLVEAGYGGNPKAFKLVRGYYDWFDRCRYLPELLRRGGQGVQGMIGNTRAYFTPVGKPADLQVVQRYFQEDYWLDELAKREDRAIWQYPYDHPHCYLLTSIEPYLDLYRATGAKRYLDAARGARDLYHDKWEHVGGSIAICEGDSYPPGSYFLHRHTGELCGSVFWARLNQRFHLLYPDDEKYVAEIEKSIYNVGLANQDGSRGIRYHANLVGHKDPEDHKNTCCEGQGTRLIGSLPEYLYSVAADGLYVDMFAPSTITWKERGRTLGLRTETSFPFGTAVTLRVSAPRPTRARIRVRVPGWAAEAMPTRVDGAPAVVGKPGSYAVLDRTWRDGDSIAFTLPAAFRLTRYRGAEPNSSNRYALEWGPVLMAAVSRRDPKEEPHIDGSPADLVSRLRPEAGQPLHYAIAGDPQHEYVPYWEVGDQAFSCYPGVGGATGDEAPNVGAEDLALASRGAVATSDSEYANEPGCTPKVIDGIIATPADFANRWHSSLDTPHPHWVQVDLPRPERVSRIVVWFADPAGYPVSFQGLGASVRGGRQVVLFDMTANSDSRRYEARFAPRALQSFRFVIRSSANAGFPNAAQVSEIAIYP